MGVESCAIKKGPWPPSLLQYTVSRDKKPALAADHRPLKEMPTILRPPSHLCVPVYTSMRTKILHIM